MIHSIKLIIIFLKIANKKPASVKKQEPAYIYISYLRISYSYLSSQKSF
jgi:hypothetical protein